MKTRPLVFLIALAWAGHAYGAQPRTACEGPLNPQWSACVGTHTFAWGHRYEGEWKVGKMHGNGRLYSENGQLIQEGAWADGVFQGTRPLPSPVQRDAPARVDFASCLKPAYPVGARSSNAQGDTGVEYTLGVTGRIDSARVVTPSGESESHRLLDMLAVDAVRACRGTPQILNGYAVPFVGRVSYAWRLVDEKKPAKQGNQSLDMRACPAPTKTTAATRADVSGRTIVAYALGLDGRVTDAGVEISSGPTREHKQLDRAALEAVKACAGKPNTLADAVGSIRGAVHIDWQ